VWGIPCVVLTAVAISGIYDIIRFELRIEDESILGEAMIKWTRDVAADDRKKVRASRSGCRIVSMATEYRAVLKGYLSKYSFSEA